MKAESKRMNDLAIGIGIVMFAIGIGIIMSEVKREGRNKIAIGIEIAIGISNRVIRKLKLKMASDIEPKAKETKRDEPPKEAVIIQDFEMKTDEKEAKREEEGNKTVNGIGIQEGMKAKREEEGNKTANGIEIL